MRHLINLLALLLYFSYSSFAQSVISNGGEIFQNNQIHLAWTIGEPLNETYSESNLILSQGFHQSAQEALTTSVDALQSFSIYPNPTQRSLQIQSQIRIEELIVEMYNVDGKLVLQSSHFNFIKTQINVTHLSSGIYTLFLKYDPSSPAKISKIIKSE
ncbi:MAG: T9SS type A sorting domain-containing protein [Reichenbachiella sp.]|uniref:T9SS type A sorting domain-containing protein n=1 Tax=Reichenbachiella sp. TaxID=2184521 RepID=UPI0029669E17|nr:T9SS type A sorting domain-containing protein [Reichenbachiella sp.]MDW3211826.1 T9SS type A sorting domain-containing protein [Reichenbachiella sp.]